MDGMSVWVESGPKSLMSAMGRKQTLAVSCCFRVVPQGVSAGSAASSPSSRYSMVRSLRQGDRAASEMVRAGVLLRPAADTWGRATRRTWRRHALSPLIGLIVRVCRPAVKVCLEVSHRLPKLYGRLKRFKRLVNENE